jgi:hypothetical protein
MEHIKFVSFKFVVIILVRGAAAPQLPSTQVLAYLEATQFNVLIKSVIGNGKINYAD